MCNSYTQVPSNIQTCPKCGAKKESESCDYDAVEECLRSDPIFGDDALQEKVEFTDVPDACPEEQKEHKAQPSKDTPVGNIIGRPISKLRDEITRNEREIPLPAVPVHVVPAVPAVHRWTVPAGAVPGGSRFLISGAAPALNGIYHEMPEITRPCHSPCIYGELYRRNGFLPLAEDSSDECCHFHGRCRGTGEVVSNLKQWEQVALQFKQGSSPVPVPGCCITRIRELRNGNVNYSWRLVSGNDSPFPLQNYSRENCRSAETPDKVRWNGSPENPADPNSPGIRITPPCPICGGDGEPRGLIGPIRAALEPRGLQDVAKLVHSFLPCHRCEGAGYMFVPRSPTLYHAMSGLHKLLTLDFVS